MSVHTMFLSKSSMPRAEKLWWKRISPHICFFPRVFLGSLNLILWGDFWLYCFIFFFLASLINHVFSTDIILKLHPWVQCGTQHFPGSNDVLWWSQWMKPRMSPGNAWDFTLLQAVQFLYTVGVTDSRCRNWRSRTMFFVSKQVGGLFNPRGLWTVRYRLREPVIWNKGGWPRQAEGPAGREEKEENAFQEEAENWPSYSDGTLGWLPFASRPSPDSLTWNRSTHCQGLEDRRLFKCFLSFFLLFFFFFL